MGNERIGFIGLGLMGRPMARRLYDAGYDLVVHNRTSKIQKNFAKEHPGVKFASSAQEIAEQSNIVITMLPDSSDVRDVILDCKKSVMKGAHKELVVIDMSSILPGVARKVAKGLKVKGVRFLDAPVSGSTVGAENGELAIMVGGNEEDFQKIKGVLETFGTPTLIGGHGKGQETKLDNQVLVATHLALLARTIISAKKNGIDPAVECMVLNRGLAGSTVIERKAQMMIDRRFYPAQFRAALHLKDLKNAVQEQKNKHGRLDSFTAASFDRFRLLCALGYEDADHAAIFYVIEKEMS